MPATFCKSSFLRNYKPKLILKFVGRIVDDDDLLHVNVGQWPVVYGVGRNNGNGVNRVEAIDHDAENGIVPVQVWCAGFIVDDLKL